MKTFLRQSLLSVSLLAAFAASADSGPQVQQRVRDEVQSALVRLVDNGEISAEELATLRLDAPASRTPMFGAIVDARFNADADRRGLAVAAVTPGSSAAQLGLQAGDRLLSVDGKSLLGLGADAQGRAVAFQQLRDAIEMDDEAIVLGVERGGASIELQGAVRVVALPAYRLEIGNALAGATYAAGSGGDGVSRCGRVSVFDVAPRGRQIHRAILIAVDGALPGPHGTESFRLEAGRHVLSVAEAIDPEQFSGLQRLQRDRQNRDRYKELVLDVQPGVTYKLGAQFNVDQRNSIRDGAYWTPVIYAETAETCR